MVEFYFKDLQNGLVMHFTHSRIGDEFPPVNIAFSSWSTIKIPALLTLFKNLEAPYDPAILLEIEDMVEQSSNESTDSVAKKVIEPNLAPLRITDDIRALGLENTFWAGFFSLDHRSCRRFRLQPIKERTTIPGRIATGRPRSWTWALFWRRSITAPGLRWFVPLVFEARSPRRNAVLMVEYLGKNQIGHLIEAGVRGTLVAHKHGWANSTLPVMFTPWVMLESSTPGGDYVLSMLFTKRCKSSLTMPIFFRNSQLQSITTIICNSFYGFMLNWLI